VDNNYKELCSLPGNNLLVKYSHFIETKGLAISVIQTEF